MKISIIIPAHNEEATITQVLERVIDVDLGQWEKEVIVVDDGSSDRTGEIIEQWVSLSNNNAHCIVLHHQVNLGKGAAIRTALERVVGDYVIIQDADLEYDPKDIPNFLLLIPNSNSDNRQIAVFGARGHKAYPERGFYYVIGAWALTAFYNLLFHQRLADLYTGYKLIPAYILKSLDIQSAGFEFEAEVACKLIKRGCKIREVPIYYQPRNKQQGKHIRFKDALKGFWTIVKFRVK